MFAAFETLHKNHKLAYLDGFLCGLAVYHYTAKAVKQHLEYKERVALAKSDDTVHIITTLP